MASSAALYTPEVLALATSLADLGLDSALPLRGTARAPACGSRIELGLEIDRDGRIVRIGMAAHACAIGQASAAIFAKSAIGMNRTAIETALKAIELWLSAGDKVPDWPGLSVIAAGRDFPGRHGAILLAWRAAISALSLEPKAG